MIYIFLPSTVRNFKHTTQMTCVTDKCEPLIQKMRDRQPQTKQPKRQRDSRFFMQRKHSDQLPSLPLITQLIPNACPHKH